jgi:hypothetical protein
VATGSELPDPRNPGQTCTTTHFAMWRFVDGKADEHWDEGRINPPPPPKQGLFLVALTVSTRGEATWGVLSRIR